MKRLREVCLLLFAVLLSATTHAATVAYWRFETGPANTDVLHVGADGAFYGAIPDVSGNGNSLSAWTQGGYAGFAYRVDVPFGFVPQTMATNRFSVKNTGGYPAMFSSAAGSSPTGINAQIITPAAFTIEASYKAEANGGYRTVVGRDARNVSTTDASLAALYLQVRPDDSVGILFTDVSGYTHSAFSPPGWIYGYLYSSNPEGTNTPWYHLAAVSDGDTLKFYVNNVLVATNDLTASGSPNRALAIGSTSGSGYTAGAWTVGRGLYGGNHTDRAFGMIDEVRISDAALEPGDFLAAPRPSLQIVATSETSVTFSVRNGQPGATCYVLQSTNASAPVLEWNAISVKTFDTNGTFTQVITVDATTAQKFYYLRAVLKPPTAGALHYQLAGGSENWPADIRAQIMYAMDGAVAQYNRWGTFNKQLTANYDPGVPTAQASYSGWIDFGNQRGYRTALHEIAHTLGVGTISAWSANLQNGIWTGPNGVAQIHALDGASANINSDGTHFWPYGLNYDNEASTENNRRHVIMVGAFRKDMGIQ